MYEEIVLISETSSGIALTKAALLAKKKVQK